MNLTIPELCLVVLVGASGSGKSTFARRHFLPTEVLSSDYFRGLVSDDENNQAATTDAFEALGFIARKRLANGNGGIKTKLGPKEYQNDWLPNYHYAYCLQWRAGKPIVGFDGIAYRAVSGYPTVASQIFQNLHRDGAEFEGATVDGRSPEQGDPEVNSLIEKIKREFDIKKQQELAQDFQRMMAKKAYSVPNLPFATLAFSLNWPVIGNLGVYRSWPGGSGSVTESNLEWWIDDSKPPLART